MGKLGELAQFKRGLAVALVCAALVSCGPPAGWRRAKALPFSISDGLLMAKGPALGAPSSLDVICDSTGKLRLLMRMRLPGPEAFKSPGQGDPVVLYADDMQRRVSIVMYTFSTGWIDEIVSAPLSGHDTKQLARVLGPTAPRKVAIVGVGETSVSLQGLITGPSLEQFATRCMGP